jgi:hypothetical protein
VDPYLYFVRLPAVVRDHLLRCGTHDAAPDELSVWRFRRKHPLRGVVRIRGAG